MADISKIKLPTGSTIYNIKDTTAREAIAALPKPMVFKGTIGEGGTIEWSALPEASSENEGFTYKVITAHDTEPVCKVGDTIVSNSTSWVVIPSGDEPSGTVTNVATGAGLTGGPITTTGTISLDTTYVATTDHAGLAPALPIESATSKYLRGDGTYQELILPDDMTGATSEANGTHGLVPAPLAGDQDKALKGDGTWGTFVLPSAIAAPYSNAATYTLNSGVLYNNQLYYNKTKIETAEEWDSTKWTACTIVEYIWIVVNSKVQETIDGTNLVLSSIDTINASTNTAELKSDNASIVDTTWTIA